MAETKKKWWEQETSPTRATSLRSFADMPYGYDPTGRPMVQTREAYQDPLPASYTPGVSDPYTTFNRTKYRFGEKPAPITVAEIMKAYLDAYNKSPVTYETQPGGKRIATRSMPMWDMPSEMGGASSQYGGLFYNPTQGGQRGNLTSRFVLPALTGGYASQRNVPTSDVERGAGFGSSTSQATATVNPPYRFGGAGLLAPTRPGPQGNYPVNNAMIDYTSGQAYAPPPGQRTWGAFTTGEQYRQNVQSSPTGVNRFQFQPTQQYKLPNRRYPWQRLY